MFKISFASPSIFVYLSVCQSFYRKRRISPLTATNAGQSEIQGSFHSKAKLYVILFVYCHWHGSLHVWMTTVFISLWFCQCGSTRFRFCSALYSTNPFRSPFTIGNYTSFTRVADGSRAMSMEHAIIWIFQKETLKIETLLKLRISTHKWNARQRTQWQPRAIDANRDNTIIMTSSRIKHVSAFKYMESMNGQAHSVQHVTKTKHLYAEISWSGRGERKKNICAYGQMYGVYTYEDPRIDFITYALHRHRHSSSSSTLPRSKRANSTENENDGVCSHLFSTH